MDTPISLMNERIGTLCDHIASMAKEMAGVRECMGGLRADVGWLKKSFWLLAGITGTALATGVVAALFR